ncbi:hypothetical protein GBF38_007836 [Nibea albiflora]|uniref:Uncharacterized protein n=1 Tax=Nibea albiflora TaxID=240163 RepID=A0ACB7EPI8_NIBAL|nr:hypothetical protein GBF38_007836 [Nibea albiflora]
MQQYYRIALGMCLLIGYLQALPRPIRSLKVDDLGLDDLEPASCGGCYDAILALKKGLEHASKNCDHTVEFQNTLDTLGHVLNGTNRNHHCTFTMTVYEQFGTFLNATKEFVQQHNSIGN